MNTPYFIYEIDQRKKFNTLGDFKYQTPTHIVTTHAFSKILQKFENRIPRELDQKVDQHDSLNHFQFFEIKGPHTQKDISLTYSGIQPR